ncbi:MAG: hypothetical protein WAN03_01115 [Candidatus Sulfotelmatobacter sp.]
MRIHVFKKIRQPGEKLVEDLFYESEQVDNTSFAKIKRARGLLRDWNALAEKLNELEAVLFLNGSDSIRAKLKEILPEFSYLSGDGSDVSEQGSWLTARSRIA